MSVDDGGAVDPDVWLKNRAEDLANSRQQLLRSTNLTDRINLSIYNSVSDLLDKHAICLIEQELINQQMPINAEKVMTVYREALNEAVERIEAVTRYESLASAGTANICKESALHIEESTLILTRKIGYAVREITNSTRKDGLVTTISNVLLLASGVGLGGMLGYAYKSNAFGVAQTNISEHYLTALILVAIVAGLLGYRIGRSRKF